MKLGSPWPIGGGNGVNPLEQDRGPRNLVVGMLIPS